MRIKVFMDENNAEIRDAVLEGTDEEINAFSKFVNELEDDKIKDIAEKIKDGMNDPDSCKEKAHKSIINILEVMCLQDDLIRNMERELNDPNLDAIMYLYKKALDRTMNQSIDNINAFFKSV